ncbi:MULTISPECIES: DUF805 domain-containing protein [Streptomyces]|uniref:Integral membrane protein n=1 Tax=Streptomyces venezuelae (strain ATCC 10712 / CBS 650.69 / DSM 40230 / JCM 4526 / NBRC 13096 / PD 04745) TaxID=953739 RepID=F2R5N2_STRVP|nr:DUF805 domain-containing protein [Streptomyces venezuelae]APE19753.1 hypothetical protein vnz_01220 [Streptomyces venezuelae]QER97162.1 DUF805 domain-containing protein [Streptomyces venezuelae ATCC 10712]CCA53543.1 Integral membrane protein [Streptomyces venezuelae ATCC 10712]
MNWYLEVLKKYVVFNGRARRKEFWMFELINVIISIVLTVVDLSLDMQLLSTIYSLGIFLPSLAVTVRRLHDTGRSGWWVLIGLVPLVGFIVLLIFACTEGDQHENEHGPNPKLAPAY